MTIGKGKRNNQKRLESRDDAAGHIGRERVRPARDLEPREHAGGVARRAALLRVATPCAGEELPEIVAPRYGLSRPFAGDDDLVGVGLTPGPFQEPSSGGFTQRRSTRTPPPRSTISAWP